jgi:hypothetical protein
MMILQPEMAEIKTVLYAIKIMGLDPATFALIFIGVAGICGWFFKMWWDDRKRTQNIAKTKNGVLLEILPTGGGKVRRILSPIYKGTAKEIKNKSGATFWITDSARIKEDDDAEGYYLIPGHGWMDEYPFDVPPKQRVPVLKYYFHENDPFPQMPLEPDKWNVEMRTNVTSSFARLSREESVAKTLIGQFSGFFEGLMKALPALQKLPLMFYIQLGMCAALAGILYFEFVSNQSISALRIFLLGK